MSERPVCNYKDMALYMCRPIYFIVVSCVAVLLLYQLAIILRSVSDSINEYSSSFLLKEHGTLSTV